MVAVHLSNDKFYCRVNRNLTEYHNGVVSRKLGSMFDKGELSEKVMKGLQNISPKTGTNVRPAKNTQTTG